MFYRTLLYTIEAMSLLQRDLRRGLGEVPQKIGGAAIGLLYCELLLLHIDTVSMLNRLTRMCSQDRGT
jgi:hypothetical protein